MDEEWEARSLCVSAYGFADAVSSASPDPRGGIDGPQRHCGQRFGVMPGFVQVGPRHARPRHRRAQVVVAVFREDEAGDRQAVLVIERMVTVIGVTAPTVVGETSEWGSVAFDADFKARRMGIS
jgi:hypothetical protein